MVGKPDQLDLPHCDCARDGTIGSSKVDSDAGCDHGAPGDLWSQAEQAAIRIREDLLRTNGPGFQAEQLARGFAEDVALGWLAEERQSGDLPGNVKIPA